MRILVTGANGYLGRGIVKRLLDGGKEVVASSTNFSNDFDQRAVIKKGDLFDVADPYSYFGEPDILLHLAWRDAFIHNSSSHIEYLPKHYKFLKQLVDSGIKRIAVMGSMHEVGFFEGSINENTPTNPLNLYGICKDALRNITKLLCNDAGIPYQWLRAYYIVGDSKGGTSVFSKIAAAEEKGCECFPFTSGQNQYDFLDYNDFCDRVSATVIQDKVTGIIDICSGRPEKLADRVERFIRENNFKISLDFGRYPDRPYDSAAIWGNDFKIRDILNRRA